MNNHLSYCGLTDARMRASEKDLPVWCLILCFWRKWKETRQPELFSFRSQQQYKHQNLVFSIWLLVTNWSNEKGNVHQWPYGLLLYNKLWKTIFFLINLFIQKTRLGFRKTKLGGKDLSKVQWWHWIFSSFSLTLSMFDEKKLKNNFPRLGSTLVEL